MNNFIFLFLLALSMDLILGDPHSRFHPVALFGTLARKWESFCRKYIGNGIFAGFIGWLFLTFGAAVFAGGSVWLAGKWHPVFALFVSAGWLYVSIALKSLLDHARNIRLPLSCGNLTEARRALSMIVTRDTDSLEESEIVRGGVESVGENLIDAVTSALFWAAAGFVCGGLPGAAAGAVFLRAVNTLDASWGYRNERYLFFGRIAAKADDFIHWIPARLTLPVIAFAALLTGGSALEALKKGIRHRHDHPSPNSGYGMAGFAGALNIRLGGPTVYHGELERYPYWGDGRHRLNCRDLLRAERLAVVSAILFMILLCGLFFLIRRFAA